MPPDPPNLRFLFVNAKYQFKQYFSAGQNILFRKYSDNPNTTPPPLQNFLGKGLPEKRVYTLFGDWQRWHHLEYIPQ